LPAEGRGKWREKGGGGPEGEKKHVEGWSVALSPISAKFDCDRA